MRPARRGHRSAAAVGVFLGALVVAGLPTSGSAAPEPEPLFAAPLTFSTEQRPFWFVAGDVNNDGSDDLLLPAERHLLLSDGKGGFATLPAPFAGRVADVDSDGNLDLLAVERSRDRLAVYLGDGRGGFAEAVHDPTGGSYSRPLAWAVPRRLG
jgi:hypothetical protein